VATDAGSEAVHESETFGFPMDGDLPMGGSYSSSSSSNTVSTTIGSVSSDEDVVDLLFFMGSALDSEDTGGSGDLAVAIGDAGGVSSSIIASEQASSITGEQQATRPNETRRLRFVVVFLFLSSGEQQASAQEGVRASGDVGEHI
jgi:hypothetical protein